MRYPASWQPCVSSSRSRAGRPKVAPRAAAAGAVTWGDDAGVPERGEVADGESDAHLVRGAGEVVSVEQQADRLLRHKSPSLECDVDDPRRGAVSTVVLRPRTVPAKKPSSWMPASGRASSPY